MVISTQDYLPRLCPSPATDQQARLKPSDQIEIWNIFNTVLRRITEKLIGQGEIHDELVTISDRMEIIILRLNAERTFLFSSLITRGETLIHLIASFLAILELTRLKQLILEQDSHFSDIRITAVAGRATSLASLEMDTDEETEADDTETS